MVRSAGVLMSITSLPSPYGIGTIGDAAYKFADFLKKAGQKYWQILPIGPTSYGDSPYQSFSTFAGNPYMIDLDYLKKDKLLKKGEYENLDWGSNDGYVDYEKIYNNRFKVLRIAFARFKDLPKTKKTEFESFLKENSNWIENYSLYMSVKSSFDMKSWLEWDDDDIKLRKPEAVEKYKKEFADDMLFWQFVQYKFFEQWKKFKSYVNSLDIKIVGDIPIYVAADSADMWANPQVFLIDEKNNPKFVAGCPPDYFSATGQLWGNPIYDWDYLKSTDYKWWFERIKNVSALFDVTRIDHFRAFDSYYTIPYGAENAINGSWREGPGIEFFDKMREQLGEIEIIAEDLGLLTPGVKQLLKDSGYPGMKILEFAFDSGEANDYLPHNYTKNCVVYTGTHDNDTLMGWYNKATDEDKQNVIKYCRLNEQEGYNWGVIRTAYSSISNCAIIQMQDFLGLDSEARMNIPSTTGGNWTWRLDGKVLTDKLAQRIYDMTLAYDRMGEENMKNDNNNLIDAITYIARSEYCKELNDLSESELHNVVGKAVMGYISKNWERSKIDHSNKRRAYYFSAEFLMGRMIYNNLYCLGILDTVKSELKKKGIDISNLEDVEDAALGNGGLGRLAACFLDSAATHDIPLDGYGIRYKYGLFKQELVDGRQVEVADDWQRFGDPWCIRRAEDAVKVRFADQEILAVPYDMAIIGYGTDNINTLRLWQSEAVNEFGFVEFNNGDYAGSVIEKNSAENISKVLYPNDNSYEGKRLRLKQQYFFCSASLQDILKKYKKNGNDFSKLADFCAIQLNDTHPVVSIPELIRLLQLEGVDFEYALNIAKNIFAYTNHTVMSEALEKWNIELMRHTIPEVYEIIDRIHKYMENEYRQKGLDVPDEKGTTKLERMRILDSGIVHMARLAIYASKYTNGVAEIHTDILKHDVLDDWYAIYPERFQNKTNGITQRRWLGLANPELSAYITKLTGSASWVKELSDLEKLNDKITARTAESFNKIKHIKKEQLSEYIEKQEGIKLDPSFIFDIQVKRMHEYKRQLLNAFSIMDIYFRLKDGTLTDFQPTAFIFGAKAAPGYARAKAIIKYINEIANKINNDPDVNDKLKVVFVSNYNVTYAEKIVVAADISEQISTAGTEASGTGNMKFMMNGAVTLGTYDGANVEIVKEAGKENNYIFGARVEEIRELANSYDPKQIYESNPQIKRVLNTLVDGTFNDGCGHSGEGSFEELFNSLINGASWHKADHYYLLRDLPDYIETKLRANKEYQNRAEFGKKCLRNIAKSGKFSSDRTIKQYAKELWNI